MEPWSGRFDKFLERIYNGCKFYINFKDNIVKLNGKEYDILSDFTEDGDEEEIISNIEALYEIYKRSVPSIKSEKYHRIYFKAKNVDELTSDELICGEARLFAKAKLEGYVYAVIKKGFLKWNPNWGNWFWQSKNDSDLILLKGWW